MVEGIDFTPFVKVAVYEWKAGRKNKFGKAVSQMSKLLVAA
jgi:hypothetical protein